MPAPLPNRHTTKYQTLFFHNKDLKIQIRIASFFSASQTILDTMLIITLYYSLIKLGTNLLRAILCMFLAIRSYYILESHLRFIL